MVSWILRGVVLLWAAFFFLLGARGILDPGTFTDMFGIGVDGAAANTVRADLSAFFLVSAGGAAIGALLPGWRSALLVPAALYGTALVGRLIGVAGGDLVNGSIVQAMIVEALSALLMIGSWRALSRPSSPAEPGRP